MTNEQKLLSQANAYFKFHKIPCYRPQTNIRGNPDLIICYNGKFISFELKGDVKKYGQSKFQEMGEQKIKLAGGKYYIVETIKEIELRLNEN